MNIRTLGWVATTLADAGGMLVKDGLAGAEEREWRGAAVDSRAECSGRLFFALRGEQTDGHQYVKSAISSGGAAAVVDDASVCGDLEREKTPYLLVDDGLRSLQELARAYRSQMDIRVIAITGSAGKTTTKEFVRRVMRTKFRTFANPGNFNSMIGVPITILETESDNEYLVSEVGANQPGEVGFLSELLRPDVGVITNVGDAHVGMFGSVDNIANAKAELLDHIESHGYAVLFRDDAFFEFFAGRTTARVVSFGRSEGSDFRVTDVSRPSDRAGTAFKVNDVDVTIGAVGEYNALNACAAFAVGDLSGVEYTSICRALAEIVPMPGRGRVHEAAGVTIVDESYNASPASMNSSLMMLQGLDASRRVAVLGDMMELGDFAPDRHRDIGERLAATGADAVFWLGDFGASVKEGFERAGGSAPVALYESFEKLARDVGDYVRSGDAVLVKASRAMGLDRLTAQLLETLNSKLES